MNTYTRFLGSALFFLSVCGFGAPASAQSTEAQPAVTEATPPPPRPYALPFQLRGAGASNVIRLDTAIAGFDNGATVAPMLTASWKALPTLALGLRFGYAQNLPVGGGGSSVFTNPLVSATYVALMQSDLRITAFGGLAPPIGQGGGDSPAPERVAALGAGRAARSALDNTLFAVNYGAVVAGGSLAYLVEKFTLQCDLTLLQGFRMRGPDTQDSAVTNSTANLWVGYTVIPEFVVGVELRHQHYLSTPAAVRSNDAARSQTSVALGVRTRIPLSDSITMPLGVSYARGLDSPMSSAHYNVFFVDIPFVFQ